MALSMNTFFIIREIRAECLYRIHIWSINQINIVYDNATLYLIRPFNLTVNEKVAIQEFSEI